MGLFRKKCLFLGLIIVASMLAGTGAVWAEANASAQKFLPAIDASQYFSNYSSQTMQQKQFRLGSYFNYAYRPVEFGINGERRGPIIDHLLMADFGAREVVLTATTTRDDE